ncbi:metallophosphoesterase family protein [Sphingomonas oryzagri]
MIDRFAAVSDIHGNLPALDAVIDAIRSAGIEHVVNLGDCLSGPLWPADTGRKLMALEWPTIAGNHDRQLLDRPIVEMGAHDAYAAVRLTPELRQWLGCLPTELVYAGNVFLCHGTPRRDDAYWLHRGSRGEMREATLDEIAADAVPMPLALCGHTHLPRAVKLDDGRLIANPGSVGFPARQPDLSTYHCDDEGTPRARYLIADREGDGWKVQLEAVSYDVKAAARQAERNGRPKWAQALLTGHLPRKKRKAGA